MYDTIRRLINPILQRPIFKHFFHLNLDTQPLENTLQHFTALSTHGTIDTANGRGMVQPAPLRLGKTSFYYSPAASEYFEQPAQPAIPDPDNRLTHQGTIKKIKIQRRQKEEDAANALRMRRKRQDATRKNDFAHFVTYLRRHTSLVIQNLSMVNSYIIGLQDVSDQVVDFSFSVSSIQLEFLSDQDVARHPNLGAAYAKVARSLKVVAVGAQSLAHALETSLQVCWTESFLLERCLTHFSFFEAEVRQQHVEKENSSFRKKLEEMEENQRSHATEYAACSGRRAAAELNVIATGQVFGRRLQSAMANLRKYEGEITRQLAVVIRVRKAGGGLQADERIHHMGAGLKEVQQLISRTNRIHEYISHLYQDNTLSTHSEESADDGEDSSSIETMHDSQDDLEDIKDGFYYKNVMPSILQRLIPQLGGL